MIRQRANSTAGCAIIVTGSLGAARIGGEPWYFCGVYNSTHIPPTAQFTELVQAAGHRVAQDYLQLDRHLRPQNREEWDASDLGERSHYNCRLLLEGARAVALVNAVRGGGKHMVYVDDPLFAFDLYRMGRQMGLEMWWQDEGRSLLLAEKLRLAIARARCTARAARAFAGGLRATLKHVCILRALRREFPIATDELRAAKVVITLWTDAKTFNPTEPAPRHSTFGPLPQALLDQGIKTAYLAMPLSWIGKFSEIARKTLESRQPVLLLEDCWTPWLVVRTAMACLFRHPRLSANWIVDGVDLTPLVKRAAERSRLGWRRVHARLCAAVGAKLAELGMTPRAVMAPFENQSWEKLLRAGVQKSLPSTQYVACQLSLFDVDYHSFYPTYEDVTLGRIPDRLLTMGAHFTDLFLEHGFPAERMAEIGALRYPPLDGAITMREVRTPLRILCGSSVEIEESVELAQIAAAAIANLPGAEMVVNFHPVTDDIFRNTLQHSLERCHAGVLNRISYSTEPASRLLETVDVALYNTSGVAFDAMARGVPSIYVRRELGLDHDKMLDSVAVRVRGAQELAKTLSDLASGHRKFHDETVEQALRRSMGPVCLDGLAELLATNHGRELACK